LLTRTIKINVGALVGKILKFVCMQNNVLFSI